jgi:hypothetical protein
MLPFATSLSWRVLTYLKHSRRNPYLRSSTALEALLPSIHEAQHQLADDALNAWAALLSGQSETLGRFTQHVIFLNGKNVPHERHDIVGFTLYSSDVETAVFSQIGPVCVLGFIAGPSSGKWVGTEVQGANGEFWANSPSVPGEFGTWLAAYFANLKQIE